jgi:membrane protease YdiL (CAAX protease family)
MGKQIFLNRRLLIFLAAAFGMTWGAWGVLGWLARAQVVSYGQWPFMALYVLGGLGPTIAAYVAVLSTSAQAPLREFHRRLFRWRVAGWWYVVAIGLPVSLAIVSTVIATQWSPGLSAALSVRPWYMFLPLFAAMIVGGGLEELGWRGVTQPELTRTIGPAKAALWVGLIWAIWHLPLFFLPGVSQYGGNFPIFAIGVIGIALMLGWLYSRTDSILLCIFFHAASNAITAFGFSIPRTSGWVSLVGPCLNLLMGSILLLAVPLRSGDRAAAG